MGSPIDIFTNTSADPHGLYAELRERDGGVHYVEGLDAWVVLRYDDVSHVYRHPQEFSSGVFWQSPAAVHQSDDPVHQRFASVAQRALIFLDPPVHTRMRGLVRHAFTPRGVKRMAEAIERVTDQLVAGIEPGRQIEFISEFAEVLPVWVIAEIVGIPVQDRALFRKWSNAQARTLDPACQGEDRENAYRLVVELLDYLDQVVADRRRHPMDDLVSTLLLAEEGGERLTADELSAIVAMLMAAGNETTTHLLGNSMHLLLEHPDQRELLRQNPSLVDGAVEEMLRYEAPLRWNCRKVGQQPVELGGQEMKAGQLVWVGIAAANRDPRFFDRPEVFDITRTDNRHFSFGSGIHYCLGAALARLEAHTALPKLLGAFPNFTVGDGEAVYKTDVIARGFEKLPLVLR